MGDKSIKMMQLDPGLGGKNRRAVGFSWSVNQANSAGYAFSEKKFWTNGM